MIRIPLLAGIAVIVMTLIAPPIMSSDAGAAKKKGESQQEHTSERIEQQPGQPLYFDPERARGAQIDDSAPYSDPMHGRDHEAAGGGAQRGPAGVTEVPPEEKRIEGPVRYELVK